MKKLIKDQRLEFEKTLLSLALGFPEISNLSEEQKTHFLNSWYQVFQNYVLDGFVISLESAILSEKTDFFPKPARIMDIYKKLKESLLNELSYDKVFLMIESACKKGWSKNNFFEAVDKASEEKKIGEITANKIKYSINVLGWDFFSKGKVEYRDLNLKRFKEIYNNEANNTLLCYLDGIKLSNLSKLNKIITKVAEKKTINY